MTVMVGRGYSRRNIPSDKRNEDQDVPPIIQGNVPRGFIDKDMATNVLEEWELGNI